MKRKEAEVQFGGMVKRSFVAKCPNANCGHPHRYVEVTHPMANDWGGWVVECENCKRLFTIRLRNPEDSFPKDFNFKETFDDEGGYDGAAPPAKKVIQFSLDMNSNRLRFNYGKHPIYYCTQTGKELETPALKELQRHLAQVHDEFANAENNILARRAPDMAYVVIRIPVPCTCGAVHRAAFYFSFRPGLWDRPNAEDMLLADIEGTSLADDLTGIFSKTVLMDALEKLIARWRLKYDQVVIASPFIAHQFLTREMKLEVWEWLLGILDPGRTTFVTRAASYKDYKSALLESGLDHSVLQEFGLENRIVGAGNKKQAFHAKVYIGLGDTSEVFSGSANLVRGPSLENASFMAIPLARVQRRYLDPLSITMKSATVRSTHHLLIEARDGKWGAWPAVGPSPI
ncbi:hypothetical protein [Aminobacter sp. Piv2-1]|uniref:hypothetical protein n=1 Tax=Aminobacter sp. Piv2-1 TaxID=3031122 RepID=UPI0030A7E9BE